MLVWSGIKYDNTGINISNSLNAQFSCVSWIVKESQQSQFSTFLTHPLNNSWLMKYAPPATTVADTCNLIVPADNVKTNQVINKILTACVVFNIKFVARTTVKFYCWNWIFQSNTFNQAFSQNFSSGIWAKLPFKLDFLHWLQLFCHKMIPLFLSVFIYYNKISFIFQYLCSNLKIFL